MKKNNYIIISVNNKEDVKLIDDFKLCCKENCMNISALIKKYMREFITKNDTKHKVFKGK